MPSDDPPAPFLALRVVTMPRETNQYGTIFGGVILSYIDQAGFVQARRHAPLRWVTVALDRVEFKHPVNVGDVVSFLTRTTRLGRTSVTVAVDVHAERYHSGQSVHVTTASLVMVAVDDAGRAIPFQQAQPLARPPANPQ
ncbi:MAG: acyl-CoA thioesterase [Planctomyces sp.]|nr:acyl-CoA thioesterase [Planctomyces sp.]MBA4119169.1 acyl-CoA thioesterase [Isosphaera sp.]